MVPLYSKNDGTYVTQVKIEELNGDRKVPKVSIDVIGLQKIDSKRFLKACEAIQTSKTVEELLLKTSECQEVLKQTNCFETVVPYVSFEEKEGIRIQWNVKEKINNLSFGTSVNQKGHLSGDVTVEAACLLKRFHNACLNGSLTLDKNFELKTSYNIPHLFQCPLGSIHSSIQLFNEKIRKNFTSCYAESEAGIRLKWNATKKSASNHTLTLESVMRRLEFLPHSSTVPSFELSQVPKQSWKSSIQWFSLWNKQIVEKKTPYDIKIDTEAHVNTQLAYLHEPHFLFVKPEAHLGILFQFLKSWSVSCTLAAGCLLNPVHWFPWLRANVGSSREHMSSVSHGRPWSCSLSQIPLQDRFHMGGAYGGSSLGIFKGFAPRSIGPVSPRRHKIHMDTTPYWMRKPSLHGYDYLGGTVFSSIQIAVCRSLFTLKCKSLPSITPSGVAFLNAGVLGTSANLYYFKESFRSACGIGVSFPFTETATFDVLLCKPLKKAGTDVTDTFQMGFRVNNISFH